MQIFDSLTKKLQNLELEKEVTLYVCGLTPYDQAHIGHARTYVSFDLIKRYLIKKGHKIRHIQNITDVDDKIIKRCKENAADPKKLTSKNHDEALELFDKLGILRADFYPSVTQNLGAIINMIKILIEKKVAYETTSGVYFEVSKFNNYGKLSNQSREEMKAGSRKEIDETKNDPADFALWKKTNGEIIEFNSPWGNGRPGWHIECSAIASKFGKTIDIHGGARDLIFPHHENEIAQSECANNQIFSRYWMHTGFLTVSGEKMSKSLGNFVTLKDALNKNTAQALRLFYLQAHYRSPLDYDTEQINAAEESIERIFNSYGLLKEAINKEDKGVDIEFRNKTSEFLLEISNHLENDFNTPEAIASLFGLLRITNSHAAGVKIDKETIIELIKKLDEILWIFGLEEKQNIISAEKLIELLEKLGVKSSENNSEKLMEEIIKLRIEVRNKKDYKKSDQIRDLLKEAGITLEDTPNGIRWKCYK